MSALAPTLMRLLQPPYGWILLIVMAMPFWLLFLIVFMRGFEENDQGSLLRFRNGRLKSINAERELVSYASLLTATWLLIVAFKVYQQYFAADPLAYTGIGVFDLGLGLFSLASWAGMLILRTQQRL